MIRRTWADSVCLIVLLFKLVCFFIAFLPQPFATTDFATSSFLVIPLLKFPIPFQVMLWIIMVLIWLFAIISAVIGLKIKLWKNIFLFTAMIIAFGDAILSLAFLPTDHAIVSSILSIMLIIFGIKGLYDLSKLGENEVAKYNWALTSLMISFFRVASWGMFFLPICNDTFIFVTNSFYLIALSDIIQPFKLIFAILIILLWLFAMVCAALGMKRKLFGKISLIITMSLALLDALLSIVFSSIEFKVGSSVLALLIILSGIKGICDLDKNNS